MFGIGLPEMIVILAVALIVVGPDKLPDLARSVAKWAFELKKTVNQVKASLADEDNLLGSVHSDLRKTGDDLKGKLLKSDDFTWHEPGDTEHADVGEQDDVIDMDVHQADQVDKDDESGTGEESRGQQDANPEGAGEQDEPSEKPSP